MKKIVFAFLIILATLQAYSQPSFIGFDQVQCADPMVNVYSDSTTGPGSFKVFRNGVEVYNRVAVYHGFSNYFNTLAFINDSTGFLVYTIIGWTGPPTTLVYKTADFGNSWIHVGVGLPGYRGIYVVNKNYAYIVCCPGFVQVVRCSDIQPPDLTYYSSGPPSFIYDPAVTPDVYKTDTIFGGSLCNIDSLNIFIQNTAGDTIDYHINLFSIPLGIKEQPVAKPYTIFPNPAKNKITLVGPDFSSVEIYSLQGVKIYSGNSTTIDINDFPIGIYFIRIVDLKGTIYNSKFIKD